MTDGSLEIIPYSSGFRALSSVFSPFCQPVASPEPRSRPSSNRRPGLHPGLMNTAPDGAQGEAARKGSSEPRRGDTPKPGVQPRAFLRLQPASSRLELVEPGNSFPGELGGPSIRVDQRSLPGGDQKGGTNACFFNLPLTPSFVRRGNFRRRRQGLHPGLMSSAPGGARSKERGSPHPDPLPRKCGRGGANRPWRKSTVPVAGMTVTALGGLSQQALNPESPAPNPDSPRNPFSKGP
jgi:hypothetical protein